MNEMEKRTKRKRRKQVRKKVEKEKIPYMKSNHQLKDKKNISLNKKIIRKQQVQK